MRRCFAWIGRVLPLRRGAAPEGRAAGQGRRDEAERLQLAWEVSGRLEGSEAVDQWVGEALAASAGRTARRAPLAVAGRVALASMAAGLLFAGLAGWWSGRSEGELLASNAKLPTEVELADGSVITLDAGARASVHFDEGRRRLELREGHAYFEIARDPERPFTVQAGPFAVVVLGTHFDVARSADGADVTLVEGSIKIEPEGGSDATPFVMEKGTRLTVRSGSWRVVKLDTSPVEAWSRGKHVFRAIPLAEVAAQLNRYATVPVSIDPELGKRRLSGVFSLGDTGALADAAQSLFPGVTVERSDGAIRIGPEGKPAG